MHALSTSNIYTCIPDGPTTRKYPANDVKHTHDSYHIYEKVMPCAVNDWTHRHGNGFGYVLQTGCHELDAAGGGSEVHRREQAVLGNGGAVLQWQLQATDRGVGDMKQRSELEDEQGEGVPSTQRA